MQRLTGAEWKDGATLLYGYQYNYDKVGNRLSLLADGTVACYSYNNCNELTDELCGSEEIDYEYDGRGNCVSRSVEGGTTTYFEYNARNLITRIDTTELGFTPNLFSYNALGQRISKTDSTGTTYYVWDGLHILLEHDGAGTITRRYTYGHEAVHGVAGLIDVEDASGGAHYFYHFDQVGGVRALTTESAATDTTYEYRDPVECMRAIIGDTWWGEPLGGVGLWGQAGCCKGLCHNVAHNGDQHARDAACGICGGRRAMQKKAPGFRGLEEEVLQGKEHQRELN